MSLGEPRGRERSGRRPRRARPATDSAELPGPAAPTACRELGRWCSTWLCVLGTSGSASASHDRQAAVPAGSLRIATAAASPRICVSLGWMPFELPWTTTSTPLGAGNSKVDGISVASVP
ncbi:unnamed protein product [Prorocentrum cordatum]|uniref:Uncharacterized protein n=1 Tax=Prorocentrum cordatum TaxID=2364126 RepID=A0ABN9X4E9_9DINO|nr:unnamed protein product [Polarella glacialis]